ncbi:MAG: serine/threonine protein kinase [Planctomycetes bacterium]|nr:serine/threonine protein kinase [Planctomycetota bacterium]
MVENDSNEFKPVEEHTLLEVGSDSASVQARSERAEPSLNLRFGQVQVTRELGAGGMGKVYKGHHLGLDVPVAVKTMSGALARDEMGRQRFLREARTAAKLDHPNIVRVLDVNEQDGTPYIVMEFVDGTDLSALLKKHGPLDGVAALKAVAQVADGLAHAHAMGIVHRDIKPHNIFIGNDGRVKLGDFGLARAVEATTELTMPGAAIGTAHYMSPEQSNGRDVDQRSDIYSLGVTAYHLITGSPPYSGTTPVSIAVQHVNNDVPYDREKFGHVPDAAVYLLIAMTNRDTAQRPGAREVHDRLQQIVGQTTGSPNIRLGSLKDLLKQGSVAAFAAPAPTPSPPSPIPAFSPPQQAPMQQTHVQQPMHSGVPAGYTQPYPTSSNSSNTMLYIALGVLAFLFLIMGGCVLMFAAA